MPSYQQPLGTVSGSTGTPCANSGGDCREIPDVSADADPSTGYIIYDDQQPLDGWTALGGTSGATPLWAAVLAVVASSAGNTAGYGALNPALYQLAQQSPDKYLNDVTSGNNDYNATDGGRYPAMIGYDMATGLGTPMASELASGLTAIPLDVVVSGSQTYGSQTPIFRASADYAGSGTTPYGVTLNTSGVSCTHVDSSTTISPTMSPGEYTLLASSCSGAVLSGPDAGDYHLVYTSAANDFTVASIPVDVAVAGTQTYGGTPSFSGTDSPPSGVTVSTSGLICAQTSTSTIAPTLPAGSDTLVTASCGGATLSGTNGADYGIVYTSAAGDFTINPAPLAVTALSDSMSYGDTPPTIAPTYSGFVNNDSPSSLTTQATCSTTATSVEPGVGKPLLDVLRRGGGPRLLVQLLRGFPDGDCGRPDHHRLESHDGPRHRAPTIVPNYSGFENGDTASSLSTQASCRTTATSSSPASPPTYPSTCCGAVRLELLVQLRARRGDGH